MKKKLFLSLLLVLILSTIQPSLRAQMFSEAPITLSEKGERLTTMIYVKFTVPGVIDLPDDSKEVSGNSIARNFLGIQNKLSDFCKSNRFNLADIKVSKVFPGTKEGDTLFTDVITKEVRKLPNLSRVFIIQFPKHVNIEKILTELEEFSEVEYAHGPVQLVTCAEYPDDQYYTNGGQWYLNTIKAPEAWDITKGLPTVKVALIESGGVELTHSDLQSKIAGGDNNPAGILSGHGTWVAGFAGAITNNGTPGVASLGWSTKLLTYQPNNDDANRSVTAQKIKDAADAGAYVINLSFKTIKTGFTDCFALASPNESTALAAQYYYYNWNYSSVRDAIDYAVGKNSVVVASAGNQNGMVGFDEPCESIPYPCYPAQYSNVIAVSGSEQNNNFVTTWNYGSFIDVNAPGRTDVNTGLWSTDLNNTYTNSLTKTSGTSFSAPQVSALAALIKSINVSLTPSQVKTILENTADKVGQYSYSNGKNNYFGYGRINAYAALKYTVENYGGTFNQDVTIPAGDTWNIQPGVTLKFDSGKSLIVNGALNANGVTFTSTSGTSANSWGNIILNGSGASGSVITNSNIRYGNGIQVINVPDFEILNSNFTNNYLSIYVSGSDGLIEDNNLTSNSIGHSIQALNSSTVDCIGNTITKTSSGQNQGAGIEYGGGTSGIISENDISYCNRGISINWSSSTTSPVSPYPSKNNRVRNCGVGMVVYRLSYGTFGIPSAGDQYGQNSIYSNTLNASIGTLYTDYASGLYGCYNWWGNNPPNTSLFSVGTNAYFYYSPYLTSDTWAGFAKVNSIASTSNIDKTTDIAPETKGTLLEGIELRLNKKYREAMDFFISYIKKYPSDQQAYVELYNCRDKETTSDLINFFNSLPDEANEDHKLLLSYLYLKEGNTETAKRVNNLIISENPNTSLAAKAGINNIYLSLYNENKIETAISSFSNILNTNGLETTKEFEDVEYALQSYARINNKAVPNFSISKNSQERNTAATNTSYEFNLVGNYPNPFNPTTSINYSIPVNANVRITIYDIMGSLIKSFILKSQSSGYHQVEWNGTNENGIKVSSGTYIYRMEAVSLEGNAERYVQSKKMILLK